MWKEFATTFDYIILWLVLVPFWIIKIHSSSLHQCHEKNMNRKGRWLDFEESGSQSLLVITASKRSKDMFPSILERKFFVVESKFLSIMASYKSIVSLKPWDAVESISGWQNENWACNYMYFILFISFKMADKKQWFYHEERCKSFSVFYKFQMDKSGQNAGNSWENLLECFFLLDSNSGRPVDVWVSVFFWSSVRFFSHHRWLDDREYGSLRRYALTNCTKRTSTQLNLSDQCNKTVSAMW